MKKLDLWKRNKCILGCIMTVSLLMTSVTACGSPGDVSQASEQRTVQTVNTEENSIQEENTQGEGNQTEIAQEENTQAENTQEGQKSGGASASEGSSNTMEDNGRSGEETPVFGQITTMEDDRITVAVAQQLTPPEGEAFPESGEIPKREPESAGSSETEKPSARPEDAPGGAFPGDGDGVLPGEGGAGGQRKMSFTGETMEILVTEETVITLNGETAALEDLSVGDIITVVTENGIAAAIEAGQSQGGHQTPSAS